MDEETKEPNPFTRPAFIASAGVVGLLVILLVVVIVLTRGGREEPSTSPSSSTSTTAEPSEPTSESPTPEPTVDAGSGSICDLPPGEDGPLTTAVEAEWLYQGTTAYPSSPVYGPGTTSAGGVRTCFQHSAAGALVMAANAVVQGSDPAAAGEWVPAVLAEGPYREALLADLGSAASSGGSTRMNVTGFRVLHYDGETARIDLAIRATAETSTVMVSGVYELVWQDGDWKISADVPEPLNVAAIPDAAGYIAWGA